MKNDSLQILAKKAKQRLVQGYWQNAARESEHNQPKKPIIAYFDETALANFQNRNRDYERKMSIVRKILSTECEVTNPIRMLIDEDYFLTLSTERKQAYILQLSKEYKVMREAVMKEFRSNEAKRIQA